MKIVRLERFPEHAATVAEWLYEEWERHRPDTSLENTESAVRTMPDATGLPVSFIALNDGRPVGVARLVMHDMETRMDLSPWLSGVFVPVPHRGHRIGTKVCKAVVDEAATLGFSTLYLYTPDRERFYSRQGWQTVEPVIYKSKEVILMRMDTGNNTSTPDA